MENKEKFRSVFITPKPGEHVVSYHEMRKKERDDKEREEKEDALVEALKAMANYQESYPKQRTRKEVPIVYDKPKAEEFDFESFDEDKMTDDQAQSMIDILTYNLNEGMFTNQEEEKRLKKARALCWHRFQERKRQSQISNQKAVENNEKTYKCNWCGLQFGDREAIILHIKSKSCRGKDAKDTKVDSNAWTCTKCGKQLANKSALTNHAKACKGEPNKPV